MAEELTHRSLRRHWLAIGLVGALAVVAAARLLRAGGWAPTSWPYLAAMVWGGIMVMAAKDLDLHVDKATGRPLRRLGPGNGLTILRAACLAALAGFAFHGRPNGLGAWLPAVFYTSSDVFDYFDGYLARRSGTASAFGQRFDLELDALGLLLAVGLAVGYRVLPWWFLPLGLARYGFALLIWLRRRLDKPVRPLPASLARRPLAGLTMGYLSVVLWPILDPTELAVAGLMFAIPFSLGFLRDGLVISGVIDAQGARYARWRQTLRWALLKWAPLPMRAGLVAFAWIEVHRLAAPEPALVAGLARIGLGQGGAAAGLFAGVVALTAAAIIVGLAGRFAAFALLFPLGFVTAAVGTDWIRAVGLMFTLGILMTGCGRGSIWQPSDEWFRHRAGARQGDTSPH